PEQREAVGRLFGTSGGRGGSLSVNLERLERLLVEAGLCSNLREAVEALLGPVEDLRARREQEA
ncbi:MAG TPA: TIGR02679 family protein, partial [Myxococcales bacterium]|nr:TIGR02679 family protein [Myxococcales bacterium]